LINMYARTCTRRLGVGCALGSTHTITRTLQHAHCNTLQQAHTHIHARTCIGRLGVRLALASRRSGAAGRWGAGEKSGWLFAYSRFAYGDGEIDLYFEYGTKTQRHRHRRRLDSDDCLYTDTDTYKYLLWGGYD